MHSVVRARAGAGFYGWRIVAACLVIAALCWSLGTFGMSVYVHALSGAPRARFSVATVSLGVTVAYLVSAGLSLCVGSAFNRWGPRPCMALGALSLALGVSLLPQARSPAALYGAFAVLGVGMASLSTVAIGTTLAPWFERHQGRAMSTAMLGASIGGMLGTPLWMWGMRHWGFPITAVGAALIALAVIWPLCLWVLRHRPEDLGLHPDGLQPATGAEASVPALPWSRREAMRTRAWRTQVAGFGLALMVQVGFLAHHVPLAVPRMGAEGAAWAVTSAAVAAFVGRLLLARHVDRLDVRKVSATILVVASAALLGLAQWRSAGATLVLSIAYGLTVGNITTLAPIVVRREFGAAAFGPVFGASATLTQLAMALGPTLFGSIRQAVGHYDPALLVSAGLNLVAAAVLLWGGRRGAMGRQAVARP